MNNYSSSENRWAILARTYFATYQKLLKLGLLFGFLFFSIHATTGQCSVNAGLSQTICESDNLQLDGTFSGITTSGPIWSQVGGPSVVINDPNNGQTTISGYTGGNTYVFRWSAVCDDNSVVFQEINVEVQPITVAVVGEGLSSCPDQSGSLIINGNSPTNPGETGMWSVVGADNAGVTIVAATSATTPILLAPNTAGTTTLRWTITGPEYAPTMFCETYDELVITNYGGEDPVDAGPNQLLSNCYAVSQVTSMNASFGGINLNNQEGSWTFVSGPNVPIIADVNANDTDLSGLIEGTYILRWEVNGPCVSGNDTVEIVVPPATQDVTQISISTSSIAICDGTVTETTLIAEGTDFTNETILWEQIDANPPVTIVDPTGSITQITGLVSTNSYEFRVTLTNTITGCTSEDTVPVTFNTAGITMLANGGNNITGTCGQTTFNVPVGFSGGNTSAYSILSGPAESALSFPTAYQTFSGASTNITVFDVPGLYTVNFRRYTSGSLGTGCSEASSSLNISVASFATGANAGTDQTLNCGLSSTALVGNVPVIGTSFWTQLDGPNTATFDSNFNVSPVVSGLVPGIYEFQYSILGGSPKKPTVCGPRSLPI